MVSRFLFPGRKQKTTVLGDSSNDPNISSNDDDNNNPAAATTKDKQIELADALYSKGRKSWTKGDKEEALVLLRKAVGIQEYVLGGLDKRTARSYYFLGYAIQKHSHDYDKVLVAYRRTLKSRLWNNGEGGEDVSATDVHRSITEVLTKKLGMAEADVNKYFETAAESVRREKDADAFAEKGEYDKAVEAYEKCLAIENDAKGSFVLDIGQLWMKIGDAQQKNKEYEMSLNAYRNALLELEPALGRDHPDVAHCLKGIESSASSKDINSEFVQEYHRKVFLSLEHCRKGDAFLETKEFQKAVKEFEAARIIEEAALGKHPLTAAGIRKKLASSFESMQEYDRAIFELRTVLSINIFDCGSDHPSVVAALKEIGEAMKGKGIEQEAINRYMNTVSFSVKHQRYGEHLLGDEEDFSGAIEEFQKSLALEASLGKYHLTQGALFKGIGDAFLAKENFDFAVVNYRNALLSYQPVLGKEHIDTNLTLFMIGSAAAQSVGLDGDAVDKYRENVSESIILEKVAEALVSKGSYEEAIETYERAVALEESSLVEYHLSTADVHCKIAAVLKKSEQYERAIVKYRNILSIYLRSLGADHPNTQNAHEDLVEAVAAQGLGKDRARAYGLKVLVSIEHEARGDEDLDCERHTQSMQEFRKALEIEENSLGESHLVTAALYGKLADGYRLSGRNDEAIAEYRRTIRIYLLHKSPEHDASKLVVGLGKCIEELGFNESKGAQYQKVVWESVKSEQQGDSAAKAGDSADAIYHYQRSVSLEESVLGKLHPSTCTSYDKIAAIFRDTGDWESAIIFYSKLFAIRESHLGKDDEKTVESYNDLVNATEKQMTSKGTTLKLNVTTVKKHATVTALREGVSKRSTPRVEDSSKPVESSTDEKEKRPETKPLTLAERMKAFQNRK